MPNGTSPARDDRDDDQTVADPTTAQPQLFSVDPPAPAHPAGSEPTPAAPKPLTQVPLGPDGRPLFVPLLTADEVALWIGKPKSTLYVWRTRKKGPRAIKVGGDLRYRVEDVQAWLEENSD